mmetsp:Transcript_27072/g.42498  ORF Transcript_27072/g.42498 Transcript_27072/m.42498 type:complete len:207 (+) Transcript_27072:31-651(+)
MSSILLPSRSIVAALLLIAAIATNTSLAFAPPANNNRRQCTTSTSSANSLTFTKTKLVHNKKSSIKTPLSASSTTNNNVVEITFPTPEEAASMGIRDWPQQFHDSSWSESISEGQIATRYVLSGKGRVTIDYYDNENVNRQRANQRVYPGTLIEVDGEAQLFWEVDDAKEGIIVLTPSYEEGGKLLLVAGAMVVFCAGLIAGSTGF